MHIHELTEAVGGDFLYHGTAPDAAHTILETDRIEARTMQRTVPVVRGVDGAAEKVKNMPFSPEEKESGLISGVSTTRVLRYAQHWTQNQGVIFVLDRRRLRARKRVVALSYYGRSAMTKYGSKKQDEAEEFVIGDIHPLSSFLEAIYVTQAVYDELAEEAENQGYESILLNHPLLTILQ